MQSYDYANRDGIHPITWEDFETLAAQLAERLATRGVEVIVGIARAGLFPATLVALNLRRELYPVRVTRRVNDEVQFQRPVWRVPVSAEVTGKVVAVMDEMADTGESLAMARDAVLEKGAREVITASLVSHSWANPAPDLSALVTDALVLFPWDRQVYMNGTWQPHPELVEALEAQGRG